MFLETNRGRIKKCLMRFREIHGDNPDLVLPGGKTAGQIIANLEKLDLETASEAEVIAAGLNDSWTRVFCSACGAYSDVGVDIDVTGGEYTTTICGKCIKEAALLIEQAGESK